jgi:hypothetical protein
MFLKGPKYLLKWVRQAWVVNHGDNHMNTPQGTLNFRHTMFSINIHHGHFPVCLINEKSVDILETCTVEQTLLFNKFFFINIYFKRTVSQKSV